MGAVAVPAHSGTASACTRSRIRGLTAVITSTGHPRRVSSSVSTRPRSKRLRPGSRSTHRSRSLPSAAVPRATDPNTLTLLAPLAAQTARISARLDRRSASDGGGRRAGRPPASVFTAPAGPGRASRPSAMTGRQPSPVAPGSASGQTAWSAPDCRRAGSGPRLWRPPSRLVRPRSPWRHAPPPALGAGRRPRSGTPGGAHRPATAGPSAPPGRAAQGWTRTNRRGRRGRGRGPVPRAAGSPPDRPSRPHQPLHHRIVGIVLRQVGAVGAMTCSDARRCAGAGSGSSPSGSSRSSRKAQQVGVDGRAQPGPATDVADHRGDAGRSRCCE